MSARSWLFGGLIIGIPLVALAALISHREELVDYIDKKLSEVVQSKIDKNAEGYRATINEQIEEYRNEIADLKQRLADVQGDLWVLRTDVDEIHSSEARVDTDGSGYGLVQTRHGPFLVIGSKVSQFLDGYKVTLEIGNLSTAIMAGAKLHIGWGPSFDDKSKKASEILAAQKQKDFSVTNRFSPGAYTPVEVFLSPAKADEVKQISVKIEFDNVSLRKSGQ